MKMTKFIGVKMDTVTHEMLQKLRKKHGSISAAIRWCVWNAARIGNETPTNVGYGTMSQKE